MWFILLCYAALLVAIGTTAVSIWLLEGLKDRAYTQGFDAGFTWGERTVHIKEYGDLYV